MNVAQIEKAIAPENKWVYSEIIGEYLVGVMKSDVDGELTGVMLHVDGECGLPTYFGPAASMQECLDAMRQHIGVGSVISD